MLKRIREEAGIVERPLALALRGNRDDNSTPMGSQEDRHGLLKRIREEVGHAVRPREHALRGIRDNILDTSRSQDDETSLDSTVHALLACFLFTDLFPLDKIPRMRRPNAHRDRPGALEFVRSWDDDMFQRQFRLDREDFNWLLALIAPSIQKDEEMARRSSGSAVNPELKLLMTLRLLAGASYLEFVWYEVSVKQIWYFIEPVLIAIYELVDNVKLPYTESELDSHINAWNQVMDRKFPGLGVFHGVAAAVDGFVVECTRRTKADVGDKDGRMYVNRYGSYSWVSMAAVGAYCEFLMFEIKWPGATNDCTAFQQCEAMKWLRWLHNTAKKGFIVGDDAFSSIHERMLTPFNKRQLHKQRNDDERVSNLHSSNSKYFKMRTFNYVLSSQRITSERAFGILVRRFGCLWKAMERRERKSRLMVLVCVRLHNVCVARWKRKHPGNFRPDVPAHENVPVELNGIEDGEVTARLENKYVGCPPKAWQNIISLRMCGEI